MIRITPEIALDEKEIQESFVRSSGPGGQNVNKVATAVQIRFDVAHSPSLPEKVRARLLRMAGKRINAEGMLILDAHQYRTQEQNRADALDRLIRLIRQATMVPRARRKTKPTLASRMRRLETKRRKSAVKNLRGAVRQAD